MPRLNRRTSKIKKVLKVDREKEQVTYKEIV